LPDNPELEFQQAERFVEKHSAALKKDLRLGDLVMSHIMYIAGLQWIGTAGKLGSSHIMYWIPAVMLFFIPSGLVVVHLNKEMPLEGGLYQWAKLRFGDLAGFLVALNLWATAVLIIGGDISQLMDNVGYAAGPAGKSIVENKALTLAIGTIMIGGLFWLAIRGLSTAKWLHNAGGIIQMAILAAMILFALPRWLHGGSAAAPVAFTLPAVSLLNLNLLGKMGFGAFSGFDGTAVFTGEVDNADAARTMRRSIWLAAPLIGLFYIVGTACVLAFSRPDEIDLISPTTQILNKGAQALGLDGLVTPGALAMILIIVGSASVYFNAVIRLPMVAGWDHLLPEWLSRLHPRYRTPVGSIVLVGVTTLVMTVLGNLGTGAQESFQLINSAGLICWSLTYLVMFSIPLFAAGERPPAGIRVASICGLAMTLLYAFLSIFPIVDAKNAAAFTLKVVACVGGINAIGVWYFRRVNARRLHDASRV
jgi:glutamate:GABA antiporter